MTFIEQFYSGYKVMEFPQFFFFRFFKFSFLKRFPYTLHLILVLLICTFAWHVFKLYIIVIRRDFFLDFLFVYYSVFALQCKLCISNISSSVQHSFFVVITIIVESPPAQPWFIESFKVFRNSLVITFIKNEKEQE